MYTPLPREFSIGWADHRVLYNAAKGTLQSISSNTTTVRQFQRVDGSTQTREDDPHFEPRCLTLFLNHRCNLACRYCYVPDKEEDYTRSISPQVVRDSAEIVAANCARRTLPFVLGFHGGNEPLLNPRRIEHLIGICRGVAEKHRLSLLPVCTTNGVIPKETVQWATETFHGITLSWDGPDDIHDRWRIRSNGSLTAQTVRRTAARFTQQPGRLQYLRVRATVTAESVNRLVEIVKFFWQEKVRWVDLYPVYQNRDHMLDEKLIPDPMEFAREFLNARKWANAHGIRLDYAGTRFPECHQQFCQVLQKNLTITPDGFATACFLATHSQNGQTDPYMYGYCDEERDRMVIDKEKLHGIMNCLESVHEKCRTCFNRTHCSRGCPSVCPLHPGFDNGATFDCTAEKWIGLAHIIEAAGIQLPEEATEEPEDFFGAITVEAIAE